MRGKFNGLFYVLAGSVVGSLVTIGFTSGAGMANADCVTASGTATVACDGMLYGDMSGSTDGAVNGQGEETIPEMGVPSSSQGQLGGAEMCGAMPGSIPRC
jgi:hypothetical protein